MTAQQSQHSSSGVDERTPGYVSPQFPYFRQQDSLVLSAAISSSVRAYCPVVLHESGPVRVVLAGVAADSTIRGRRDRFVDCARSVVSLRFSGARANSIANSKGTWSAL